MFKKVFVIFVAVVFLTGCKKGKQEEGDMPAGTGSNLKIYVDIVAEKQDKFSLYYTNDGSIDFTKIKPLWKHVEGSPEVQILVYELPQEVINPQIRLDFGTNPEQQKIILRRVAISYGNEIFEVTGRHIFNYFRPDPTKCTVDIDNNAIVPKIQNGVRQTPSLYPHQEILAKEINKLTANQ